MSKMAFRGLAPLIVFALAAGCGDDDGTTDGPDPDGGTVMRDGAMPPGDGGTDPSDGGGGGGGDGGTDAFVVPGCESVICTNGTCALDGGTPICICDAGWRGDACDENDAPTASDTILWLDATDSSSLLASGGTVSAWSDLSPSGADFTQSDSSLQPTMGTIGELAALDFDGVDDALGTSAYAGFTGQGRYTLFLIVSASSDDAIVAGYGGDKMRLALIDSDSDYGLWAVHAGGVAGNINGTTLSGLDVYERDRVHLVTVQRTPVGMSIWVDGRFRKVFPNSSPETITGALDIVIGDDVSEATTSPLQGQVGEIIAYDSALDIEQRRRVEAYLGAKWLGTAPTHDESSFGNLRVWLDASNTDTLFMAAGGLVDGWVNQAGEQSFFSPTPDTNPIYVADGLNGHGVLRFDGENDTIRNAFDQPWLAGPEYSVVAVAVPRPPTSDQTSWIVTANDVDLFIPGMGLGVKDLGVSAVFKHKAPADVPGFGDTITMAGGTAEAPVLAIATWSASSMRLEGGFGTQTATPSQTEHGSNLRFWVGSHNNTASSVDNFAGDIAEVLIFGHELSFAERTALRAMLAEKWGL